MNLDIYSFVYNRPDFLEKQLQCFNKKLVDKFTFNVVCDYRELKYLSLFEEICLKNKLNFFKHKSSTNVPSMSHGNCLNYVYNNLIDKQNDNITLFLDHDMFLVEKTSLLKEVESYDIVGLQQERQNIKYVWPGLMFFKNKVLSRHPINMSPCTVDNIALDTGGGLYSILNQLKFKSTNVEYINEYTGLDEGFGFEFHMNRFFLHYRNASRWDNNFIIDNNSKKNEILETILNKE